MAQFTRLHGGKVTLKSYVRQDDDEIGITEGDEVSIVRGACIANLSGGSMIDAKLARSLGIKSNVVPIQVSNPFRSEPPFDVYTIKNGPLRIEHKRFPGGFALFYPVIVQSLFWDIILGGPSIQPLVFSDEVEVTAGPGYKSTSSFVGHNFQYENKQDKDEMHMHTSIYKLKFCGVSRGNSGGLSVSGGACCVMQYKPEMYGDETVWFDSTSYSNGDAMGTEAAYLALHLGLKYCRDQGLDDMSICICSDNAAVLKQLRGEEAVPRGTKLQVLHKVATALIQQIAGARNRISYCLIPPTANTGMVAVANRAIDAELGADDDGDEEEVDDDFDFANMDPSEALARSMLGAFGDDPTLLSLQEMKKGWGGCLNFMLSYGLKPWKPEDVEEALAISRAIKEVSVLPAYRSTPARPSSCACALHFSAECRRRRRR